MAELQAILTLPMLTGADVIVDFVGGSYWEKNMKSASMDSRMVMLGLVS